jgi:hypothetical protein
MKSFIEKNCALRRHEKKKTFNDQDYERPTKKSPSKSVMATQNLSDSSTSEDDGPWVRKISHTPVTAPLKITSRE